MRPDDWAERLLAAIGRHQAAPFVWGRHDCGTLLIDAAAAIGAGNPLAELCPWDSALTALLRLRRHGIVSVREHIAATLQRVPLGELMRGDVGYAGRWDPLSCPAIVTGAHAVSRDESGWIVIETAMLTEAYRLA